MFRRRANRIITDYSTVYFMAFFYITYTQVYPYTKYSGSSVLRSVKLATSSPTHIGLIIIGLLAKPSSYLHFMLLNFIGSLGQLSAV